MRFLRRTPCWLIVACCALFIGVAASASPRTVTGIAATHHDGQTFITWSDVPGHDWSYRVYRASHPILTVYDLEDADLLGWVGDSSAIDRRISNLLGTTLTYRTDSTAAPLALGQGLFVATAEEGGLNYYTVFAESLTYGEQVYFRPGQNCLLSPVYETTLLPRPVFQRALTTPVRGDDYVLFTCDRDLQRYPAMCNLASRAFHLGVIRGVPGAALLLNGHGRGGSFFNSLGGTGMPGEWVMAIDDYLSTNDAADFYFGYHQDYDWSTPWNPTAPPYTVVGDYSEQRVQYLIDWATSSFTHDRNRVYAMGSSMGGTFAFFLAWHHPDKIAGALAFIPKICFGYTEADPAPWLRDSFDRMWGTVDEALPMTNGANTYQWMDGRAQAQTYESRGSAPIVAFCGRNDTVVGWGEKVAYFGAMQQNHAGGAWFWDERGHYDSQYTAAWSPMQNWKQLYKFRLNQSYPAFSNCSADLNPGNGAPADGDSVGTINGFADWDSLIVDTPTRWSVTLRSRGLSTRFQTFAKPAAMTIDVTPRRLQRFLVGARSTYVWSVRRASDQMLLQLGTAHPDDQDVLTIPGVAIGAVDVVLTITPLTITGVDTPHPAAGMRLALSHQPVRGSAQVRVDGPASGEGSLELYDVSGRHARTLFSGPAHGSAAHTLSANGLQPGVYLIRATQGREQKTQRVVILH